VSSEIVRVIFTGICTFVGANVGHNDRPLTAVFPNASHHEPKHYVSMIVSKDDYYVDTDVASAAPLYSQLGKEYLVIPIDGRTIALEGVVDADHEVHLTHVDLSEEAKRQHRPATMDEMRSVDWIPSLGRSWPRMWPFLITRRMQPAFYEVIADPKLVAASFELKGGTLESHWVSSDVWRFTPRSRTRRPYETATAQEVRFDADVTSDVVRFDLCDLVTAKPCAYVRIRRRYPPDDSTDRIQVVIANVPNEDRLPESIVYCGDCGTSECPLKDLDPAPCTCVDHHYSHYYEAMRRQIPDRPSLPRRINTGPPIIPTALRVSGGNCPPGDYH
jgi:hypothetical protein